MLVAAIAISRCAAVSARSKRKWDRSRVPSVARRAGRPSLYTGLSNLRVLTSRRCVIGSTRVSEFRGNIPRQRGRSCPWRQSTSAASNSYGHVTRRKVHNATGPIARGSRFWSLRIEGASWPCGTEKHPDHSGNHVIQRENSSNVTSLKYDQFAVRWVIEALQLQSFSTDRTVPAITVSATVRTTRFARKMTSWGRRDVTYRINLLDKIVVPSLRNFAEVKSHDVSRKSEPPETQSVAREESGVTAVI